MSTCGHGKEPDAYCADCYVNQLEAERDRLRAEVERLQEQVKYLEAGYQWDERGGWTKPAPFVGYEATVTALRAALKRYGQHESGCSRWEWNSLLEDYYLNDTGCTCGLDAALAGGGGSESPVDSADIERVLNEGGLTTKHEGEGGSEL